MPAWSPEPPGQPLKEQETVRDLSSGLHLLAWRIHLTRRESTSKKMWAGLHNGGLIPPQHRRRTVALQYGETSPRAEQADEKVDLREHDALPPRALQYREH